MKHGILKRMIALCIAGGVMALTLAACGDSDSNNEGEETVLDVSQGSEDGTVDVAQNEETDTVDPSDNDVRVAHASSSGNRGNGFAIPVVKPGEEPDSGEEPKPGAGTQSGTGTQKPQQSQSNAGTQPSAGTQQPQQPQQPSTGNPTAHTHNWVTQTIHHDATGHNESRTTTEQVIIGYTPEVKMWQCQETILGTSSRCGKLFATVEEFGLHHDLTSHWPAESVVTGGDPIYGTRDKVENVWVQDSAAWDETITTCSTCGAKQ